VAKPVKSSFFATEMPEIGGAGVKNHHLEMKSTPPQFFARADFDPAGPFWELLTAASAANIMSKPPKTPQKRLVLHQNFTQRAWVLGTKISACRASKRFKSWAMLAAKSILGTKNL
jgi:hypothetical protein